MPMEAGWVYKVDKETGRTIKLRKQEKAPKRTPIAPEKLKAWEKRVGVIADVEPFVSPIDGTVISSRAQIREHEKKHNVRSLGNDYVNKDSAPEFLTAGNRREI